MADKVNENYGTATIVTQSRLGGPNAKATQNAGWFIVLPRVVSNETHPHYPNDDLGFAAMAQDAWQIDEVKVSGHSRSEADAILKVVQTKAGDPLARRQQRTACFCQFYRCPGRLSTTAGKNIITFQVIEKPSIRQVVYEGNEELDDEELGEVVDIREFGVLDRANVTRNAEKLKDLYLEKGFFVVTRKPIELPTIKSMWSSTLRRKTKYKRSILPGR